MQGTLLGAMLPRLGTSSFCRSHSTEEARLVESPMPAASSKAEACHTQLSQPGVWVTDPRATCSPGGYGWCRRRSCPALPLLARSSARAARASVHCV